MYYSSLTFAVTYACIYTIGIKLRIRLHIVILVSYDMHPYFMQAWIKLLVSFYYTCINPRTEARNH